MIKCGWVTDCHLDHIDNDKSLIDFSTSLLTSEPEALFFTGDISNSKRLVYHLSAVESIVQRPIYYVLGNHDYYGSSVDEVRKSMNNVVNNSQHLKYMSNVSFLSLTKKTAIIGHDCWYDAQNGNPYVNKFTMNDWRQIKDFVYASNNNINNIDGIIKCARKLAHDGMLHLHNGIKNAVRYHSNIVILTHVPPFEESHIYNGQQGNYVYSPWYTSKLTGDLLLQASNAYPNVNFLVLCGHTHNSWSGKIRNNLHVRVGAAEYGKPSLCELIEIM